MTYQATVYRVLIASPSDLNKDRRAISTAIHHWNSAHSAVHSAMLLPVMWETDSIPETGGRPQQFINDRLLESADIVIGAFWTRVGSHTGKEESGTIEEIKEGLEKGKKVMLYFSNRPVSPNRIDREQHQKLEEFKKWCKDKAIYHEYTSVNALRQAVDSHLVRLIQDLKREDSAAAPDVLSVTPVKDWDPISPWRTSSPSTSDLSNKACIVLTALKGFVSENRDVVIELSFKNIGRHPAHDVVINVQDWIEPDSIVFRSDQIQEIVPKGGEQLVGFTIPWLPPETGRDRRHRSLLVRASYTDGLGVDTARFHIRIATTDTTLSIEEDRSNAELSALCSFSVGNRSDGI